MAALLFFDVFPAIYGTPWIPSRIHVVKTVQQLFVVTPPLDPINVLALATIPEKPGMSEFAPDLTTALLIQINRFLVSSAVGVAETAIPACPAAVTMSAAYVVAQVEQRPFAEEFQDGCVVAPNPTLAKAGPGWAGDRPTEAPQK